MVWIKLDDKFLRCNKVRFVGRDARDLFLAALSHCNRNLTDGFIAEHFLIELAIDAGFPATTPHIKKCVSKLLEVAPKEENPMLQRVDGGYQIHDYHEYQPKRADVLAARGELSEKRSKAGKRGMASRWGDNKTITNDNKTDNKTDNKAYQNDNTTITPYPVSQKEEETPLTPQGECGGKEPSFDWSAAFDSFWNAYPLKKSKDAARTKFHTKVRSESTFRDVMEGLSRARQSDQWTKNAGQFIPHAPRWLNAGGWKDEPELVAVPAVAPHVAREPQGQWVEVTDYNPVSLYSERRRKEREAQAERDRVIKENRLRQEDSLNFNGAGHAEGH